MCEAERNLYEYHKMVTKVLKKFPDAWRALLDAEREKIEEERKNIM